MSKSGLTGSRIREKRISNGMRQVKLAQKVGISPAYLNLIEHNRRRIGGKLLVDLSRELGVEPSALSEGAEAALLEVLSDASAGMPAAKAETPRVEELAGRFPGWSALIAAQYRRSMSLERVVEALSDRLTHDPQLADSMHEVLSVVTAIHSTSAILAEDGDLDPEWRTRFHRNLYEDSQRLAQSAQSLVAYLAANDDGGANAPAGLPQEELAGWLGARNFHVSELEGPNAVPVDAFLAGQDQLTSAATTASFAKTYLERYRKDAQQVAQNLLARAMKKEGVNPLALAQGFGCDLATIMRRIACQPEENASSPFGLVVCDGSGALTFKKAIEGFNLPGYGAGCPLWPLYQAMLRPMSPIRAVVEQSGHRARRYLTYAVSQPSIMTGFDMPQLFETTMLILPDDRADIPPDLPVLPVGASCRTCPRLDCDARREPSILTNGF